MIFLRDKIEEELSWAFRCKGCGEMYVIRPVDGAEIIYPRRETVPCHQTADTYSYSPPEIENLWVP